MLNRMMSVRRVACYKSGGGMFKRLESTLKWATLSMNNLLVERIPLIQTETSGDSKLLILIDAAFEWSSSDKMDSEKVMINTEFCLFTKSFATLGNLMQSRLRPI